MTVASPTWLWLLGVPVAIVVWTLRHRVRAIPSSYPKLLRAQAQARTITVVPPRVGRARRWGWLCAGLALTVVGLARPQWGMEAQPRVARGADVMIALDLSRSMLATDVAPTRLAAAKRTVEALLDRLAGQRVGLIVFAGTAYVQSPLSADHEILRELLPELTPASMPEGGTNYRALAQAALDPFGAGGLRGHAQKTPGGGGRGATLADTTHLTRDGDTDLDTDRFLVVVSDGGATDEGWLKAVVALQQAAVHVASVGIGTTAGAKVPAPGGGFARDARGMEVVSRLQSTTLQTLAQQTTGIYVEGGTPAQLDALRRATVEASRQGAFAPATDGPPAERFQWLLAPALLCFLRSLWRELPARARPRAVTLTGTGHGTQETGNKTHDRGRGRRPRRAASAAALLLTLASLGAAGSRVAAQPATTRVPPVVTGTGLAVQPSPKHTPKQPTLKVVVDDVPPSAQPILDVVRRVAAQPTRRAADWAALAHTTVAYSRSHPPPPLTAGLVGDALLAVDAGEALDPRAANWPALRAALQRLQRALAHAKPPASDEGQASDEPAEDPEEGEPPEEAQEDAAQDREQQDAESRPSNQPPPAFGEMRETPEQEPPDPSKKYEQQDAKTTVKVPAPPDFHAKRAEQQLAQIRKQDVPGRLFHLMAGRPASTTTGADW